MDEDLLTIGSFARLCRLSVKRLRHYADLGLLDPAWVDPCTGYRYYRAGQARDALAIGLLRSLDVPLAAIGPVLRRASTGTLEQVRDRLETGSGEPGGPEYGRCTRALYAAAYHRATQRDAGRRDRRSRQAQPAHLMNLQCKGDGRHHWLTITPSNNQPQQGRPAFCRGAHAVRDLRPAVPGRRALYAHARC